MRRSRRIAVAAAAALALWLGSHSALAQKSGGVLRMLDFASPASMSIHEEVTRAAVTVLMPVFNNLVLFDPHKEKNTLDAIVPDRKLGLERGRQGADLQATARGEMA
jgi:peptide/nickel transport system substrate-binding protein